MNHHAKLIVIMRWKTGWNWASAQFLTMCSVSTRLLIIFHIGRQLCFSLARRGKIQVFNIFHHYSRILPLKARDQHSVSWPSLCNPGTCNKIFQTGNGVIGRLNARLNTLLQIFGSLFCYWYTRGISIEYWRVPWDCVCIWCVCSCVSSMACKCNLVY